MVGTVKRCVPMSAQAPGTEAHQRRRRRRRSRRERWLRRARRQWDAWGPEAARRRAIALGLALLCLVMVLYLHGYQGDASHARAASQAAYQGQYARAVAESRLVTGFPASASALETQAIALSSLERFAAAEQVMRRAISLD